MHDDQVLSARRRSPYPYAAWPFGEPAAKAQHGGLPSAASGSPAHLADPACMVRSDPASLPVGARRRRVPFPEAPREALDARGTQAAEPSSASVVGTRRTAGARGGSRSGSRRQSVVKLLLEELEDRFPALGSLRHIGVELRPAFPPPALFGFVWCVGRGGKGAGGDKKEARPAKGRRLSSTHTDSPSRATGA